MLQLEMNDSTAKLGHLLKKIDEYLVPNFRTTTTSKLDTPPFPKFPCRSLTTTPLSQTPPSSRTKNRFDLGIPCHPCKRSLHSRKRFCTRECKADQRTSRDKVRNE